MSYANFRFVKCADLSKRYACFGTTNGILLYDLWQQAFRPPMTISDGLPTGEISAVKIDETRNRIWLKAGMDAGFYDLFQERYFPGSFGTPLDTLKQSAAANLTNLFINRPYFFNGREIEDPGMRPYSITAALTNDHEDLAIGTWGLGPAVGTLRMKRADMLRIGLWGSDVSCLTVDGDALWFGSLQGGGVTRLDAKGQWQYFHAPDIIAFSDNHISAMAASKYFIWAGTDRGLLRYSRTKDVWDNVSSGNLSYAPVKTIFTDGDSLVWIGAGSALYIYRYKNDELKWVPSRLDVPLEINAICPEKDGAWIGADRGLYRLTYVEKAATVTDPKDTANKRIVVTVELAWKAVTSHPYLTLRSIYCFLKEDSILWVGSEDGLVRLNQTTVVATTFGGTGTPVNGAIYCILRTDSSVWLGTDRGVIQIDPNHETRYALYTKDDGLVDNHITSAVKQGSYLWFGTPNGVTRCLWKNVQRTKGF